MIDIDLLLTNRPFLMQIAMEVLGDEFAAEDAVQDTFMEAIRRPPRDSNKLRAWLAVVVRNKAHRRMRDRRNRRRREAVAAHSNWVRSHVSDIISDDLKTA